MSGDPLENIAATDPGEDFEEMCWGLPTCAGALEFLLDLDVGDLEAQRQQLRARESALDERWSTEVRAFRDAQGDRGLMTAGLSESLTTTWPPPDPPQVLQSVAERWLPIDQYLADLRADAADLDSAESGRPEAQDSEKELSELSEEADSLRRSEALLREQLIRDRDELCAVEERLAGLDAVLLVAAATALLAAALAWPLLGGQRSTPS